MRSSLEWDTNPACLSSHIALSCSSSSLTHGAVPGPMLLLLLAWTLVTPSHSPLHPPLWPTEHSCVSRLHSVLFIFTTLCALTSQSTDCVVSKIISLWISCCPSSVRFPRADVGSYLSCYPQHQTQGLPYKKLSTTRCWADPAIALTIVDFEKNWAKKL